MVAFVRQYQYNSDRAPDGMKLQSMCKKGHESFKEYAQRWRDLAAQVAPPMTEKEMITILVDTLPVFYYEKNGEVRTLKICGFGLHWRKDRSGFEKENLIILLGRMRKQEQMKRVRMRENPCCDYPIRPSFPPT